MFSLTVARQRGNCTRFPVFAFEAKTRKPKDISKNKIVEREIYRGGEEEVKWVYYLPAAKALVRKGSSMMASAALTISASWQHAVRRTVGAGRAMTPKLA